MLPVPLFLLWSYSMDKVSIQSGVREKYLTHFMECQTKGGQTNNSFSTGWHHSLSSTFLPHDPWCYLLMAALRTMSQRQYEQQQRQALWCSVFPPHSTHVVDVSFSQPLKMYWSEACHKLMQNNPGRVVTKNQFSPLLKHGTKLFVQEILLLDSSKPVFVLSTLRQSKFLHLLLV